MVYGPNKAPPLYEDDFVPDDLNLFVQAALHLILDEVDVQPGLSVQLTVRGQPQRALALVQRMLQLLHLLLKRERWRRSYPSIISHQSKEY